MSSDFGPPKSSGAGARPEKPRESPFVHDSVRFETKEVLSSLVLWTLVGLALTIIISAAVAWALYGHWAAQEYGGKVPAALMRQYTSKMFPPQPRLQGSPGETTPPQEDLRQMRAQAEAVLNSYGWVDRQAGIARIPIAEAMKLLAAQHLGPKEEPHPAEPPGLSASR